MTKQIKIRNLIIGGGAQIAVQSMTNVPVLDIDGTLHQISRLHNAGCDLVRIAVPNLKSVEAFGKVRQNTDMPLIADIHFDSRLAVGAIEAGADKIRINPGNMSIDQLDNVIAAAKSNGIPIRLGVNSGSIDRKILFECNGDKSLALAANLRKFVEYFESKNFFDIVLSVKSSNVKEMVAANRLISKLPYPIHLGVTEAGLSYQGIIKNAVGIGSLLLDGVGDTIRVSLTADPVEEVYAGQEILSSLGLTHNVQFVSCPKCGRCTVDLERIAQEVYDYIKTIKKNIKIAVMGCEVNGPGECKDADLGLAGANGRFVFFRKGEVYKIVNQDVAIEEFKKEIDKICK